MKKKNGQQILYRFQNFSNVLHIFVLHGREEFSARTEISFLKGTIFRPIFAWVNFAVF